METITANTYLNRREIPNLLHIHGCATLRRTEDRVTLAVAKPRATDPNILLMDLTVIEGTKPKKGKAKLFRKDLRGEDAKQYEEIHIRYNDGGDCKVFKVAVELFGRKD